MAQPKPLPIKCEYCGTFFVPCRRSRRFCSKRCSNLGAPRSLMLRGKLPGSFYERHGERIKTALRERYHSDSEYREKILVRVATRKHYPNTRSCEICGFKKAD